ncbi:MAG: hypothetical protein QNK37_33690 [Acidobacteriota bacterium]|nr:hypothetical protein [Acidobacteriota bacterium]
MFKKLLLSLSMFAFLGLGVSQVMAAWEILPDQSCCASTWNGADFALAIREGGPYNLVTCYYFFPGDYTLVPGPSCYERGY